jgi:hypothetical protein
MLKRDVEQLEIQDKPVTQKAGGVSDFELMEGKRSKKVIPLRPQPLNDPNDPLVSRLKYYLKKQ